MVTIIKDKVFKNRLKIKIILSYLFLIIFCLVFINIFAYYVLENTYLVSTTNELKKYAKNISYAASSMGKEYYLDKVVKAASKESKSRIMVINKEGIIISDSYEQLVNSKTTDIDEVLDALKGEEAWGKHITSDEKLLYVAYPVSKGSGSITGAILVLHSISNVYSNIYEVQKRLIIISIFILLIGSLFSYFKAASMTEPIEKVINAIEAMSEGELEKTVDVKGNDEIARLCHAFNDMNRKINMIDVERRQFVADASHELKSPLASIKVLVQSLIAGGIDDKKISMEFLENIDNEIDRLTGIVNNLLELTKLEGSHGFNVEVFDISALCRDVVKKLTPIAKTKGLDLSLDVQSVLVEGNRDNIFRAVYNIVENAIKYSRKNSLVNIWIEKDDMVKINIKDNGIGIPEEDLPRIFQRFYRVDKTRDRKTGGSGLGLSIAYEIVKLHKGDIKVQSKVGEGSLFIITLPYKT